MRIIKVDSEEYFRLDGCTILKAKGKNVYKIVPIKEENREEPTKEASELLNMIKNLFNVQSFGIMQIFNKK